MGEGEKEACVKSRSKDNDHLETEGAVCSSVTTAARGGCRGDNHEAAPRSVCVCVQCHNVIKAGREQGRRKPRDRAAACHFVPLQSGFEAQMRPSEQTAQNGVCVCVCVCVCSCRVVRCACAELLPRSRRWHLILNTPSRIISIAVY